MNFDLIIHGGEVIDPARNLRQRCDVGIADGKIAAVEPGLPTEYAHTWIDASGKIVTPGLIDMHVHAFVGTDLGLDMDAIGPVSGVTTMVDTGSAGAHTFEAFRRFVVAQSTTRLLPFLNISTIGIISMMLAGELENIRYCNVEAAVRCVEQYPDLIRGIKVRSSGNVLGSNGIVPVELARAAAERVGLPLMVHIGPTPPDLKDILARMRPGDILTHCSTGFAQRLIDDHGAIKPEALEARARGVIMDIGHGMGSFSFETAHVLLANGFKPDTISTDLHAYSWPNPVSDLPATLSKFLLLGLNLEEALAACTSRPAHILGLEQELGSLRPGYRADVAVFELEPGRFDYVDSYGKHMTGSQRLVNRVTIKDGQVWALDPVRSRRATD
ncbi:MAG: amidohydrolase/deacetylase family metallohydrolase [Anaerolineae bacterium]|nr:amidohydrolase/deacetylase family metallohydrolase [Anaerolineae bacterium]